MRNARIAAREKVLRRGGTPASARRCGIFPQGFHRQHFLPLRRAGFCRLAIKPVADSIVSNCKQGETTLMSIQSHLTELERKHQALEREIESERTHPSSDSLRLAELKRRKLVLKEEIERIRAGATVH